MADGSRVALDVHRAEILWDDFRRPVQVLAVGGGALAGMSLVWEHRVVFRATDGGALEIQPL